jgi:FkbM family methyltransferase
MLIRQKLQGLKALLQFDNWPMLVLARLFDRRTGLVTYRKGDLEVLVDHHGGDENGTRNCLVSDMYRKHLRGITAKDGVRVLDLGANGGGFPLLLLLSGFDVVQAVCVEMNPPTALRLLVNLNTNLGGRAIGVNAAVCGENAEPEILLERSRGSTGLSIYANRGRATEPHIAVPTITIGALCERYFPNASIDICKIDIEGAEYDGLAATPDAVLAKLENLIIEFHDPERTPSLLSRLHNAGFTETTPNVETQTGENTEVRSFRRSKASVSYMNAA